MRRNWRKVAALLAGIGFGVVSSAILLAALGGGPQTTVKRTGPQISALAQEQLVGEEFAESLGLPTITSFSEGCKYAAEAPPAGERMYCLDSVVENDREARLIGIQITGRMPTELDERLFDLNAEIESLPATPENEERRAAIVDEILSVLAEREAELGSG
jgi:hypothetical protein